MVRSSFRSVGRYPPFLVTGLSLLLIIVSVSHWNLYTNYEVFSKKVSDLEAQIGISSEKQEELTFRNDALQQLLKEKKAETEKIEDSLNTELKNEKKRLDDCRKRIQKSVTLEISLEKALKYNEEAVQTISNKDKEIETLKQLLKTNVTDVEVPERQTIENLRAQIETLSSQLAEKQILIDDLRKGIVENSTILLPLQKQIKLADDKDEADITGKQISITNHGVSGVLINGVSPLIVDPPNASRLKPLLADNPVGKELTNKTIPDGEASKNS